MGKCHGSATIPHYIERKNAVRVTVFRYIFLKKTTRRFEHCEEAWQVLMVQR